MLGNYRALYKKGRGRRPLPFLCIAPDWGFLRKLIHRGRNRFGPNNFTNFFLDVVLTLTKLSKSRLGRLCWIEKIEQSHKVYCKCHIVSEDKFNYNKQKYVYKSTKYLKEF